MSKFEQEETKKVEHLLKDGEKAGNQDKFHDEVQKLAKDHPDQLNAILKDVAKDSKNTKTGLPEASLLDHGKQIDIDSRTAGKLDGKESETYHIQGGKVTEDQKTAEHRKESIESTLNAGQDQGPDFGKEAAKVGQVLGKLGELFTGKTVAGEINDASKKASE